MTPFKLSEELIDEIKQLIETGSDKKLKKLFDEYHFADIAEIINEIDTIEAGTYIIKLLDSELTSEVLTELEEDLREGILSNLTAKEIAIEIAELDTDDAADIVAELPKNMLKKVILNIDDREHAQDIVDLLRYDENSAGGLMAKELVKVSADWTVTKCIKEMRAQAENVTRVHSIYVVNEKEELIGRLSLKDLLTTPARANIKEVYIPKVDYVNVHDKPEEVANIMSKYDLEAIPVVDEIGRLVGRITIDDIVDVIKEEAEKDYQLAAGIAQDVDTNDSILEHTKARIPWLFLGLVGGFGAALIMGGFESLLSDHAVLFFFTPLIAAMAGNVGVQSSAIIVQGLAYENIKGSNLSRLIKELLLALLNGTILSIILMVLTWMWKGDLLISLSISISLITVTVTAGIIGNFIPLLLHKRGIDPAIATGPFITTSNDIFGILIYFFIAKTILGI